MTNNDVLRRIRYTFDYKDSLMIKIFGLADRKVTIEELSNWLKKDEDDDFAPIYDKDLSFFLNGWINFKRGKKEGEQPKPEKKLTNNIVFRKLKIALDLKAEDVLAILDLANLRVSKHELSAFFRKPGQSQYRLCKDQILRNFLHGMQMKYRKED